MRIIGRCLLATMLLVGTTFLNATAGDLTATNKFDKDIARFEESDRAAKPATNGVLFIGSSSIRMWTTLTNDFPDYNVLNRGFGGSEISDAIHFLDRIVLPYAPRAIVMYSGGNDINAGESPEQVANDFKSFAARVHARLPKTHIAYIAIAPNPARWAQVDRVREANRLIEAHTRADERLSFIDVFSKMLAEDGMPKPDIFIADRLHMNRKGYALWTPIVREHLKQQGILPVSRVKN